MRTQATRQINIGDRFHDWEIIDNKGVVVNKNQSFKCKCTLCGGEHLVRWQNLHSGKSKRCGNCRPGHHPSKPVVSEDGRQFRSIHAAARGLNCDRATVLAAIEKGKILDSTKWQFVQQESAQKPTRS